MKKQTTNKHRQCRGKYAIAGMNTKCRNIQNNGIDYYSIYTLTCPIKKEVVYVGCTLDIKQRTQSHKIDIGKTAKGEWTRLLRATNKKMIVTVIASIDDFYLARMYERWQIITLNPVFNKMSKGGNKKKTLAKLNKQANKYINYNED